VFTSTGRTYKRGRSWLGVDDRRGRRSSKGVDCDILAQGLIGFNGILIPPRYTFFSKAYLQRTSGLSVLGPEQFQDR
jgi:hypothetical protein